MVFRSCKFNVNNDFTDLACCEKQMLKYVEFHH